MALDDLAFHCRNLPDNQAALLFSGTTAINGGNGVPFGRGLRCVGGAIKRLELQLAAGGEAEFGPGLGQARRAGHRARPASSRSGTGTRWTTIPAARVRST